MKLVKVKIPAPSTGIAEKEHCLIESATSCHDTHMVGSYWLSNPLCLTVLAAKLEGYTMARQHLQSGFHFCQLQIKVYCYEPLLFSWNKCQLTMNENNEKQSKKTNKACLCVS